MAETIRSLVVKLGYDVDTTGADLFKARFNSLDDYLKKNTSLSGFEKGFKKKFQGVTGRISSFAKKALLGLGAVIAAGTAAAVKVFTGFSDIQQARLTLAFRTSKEEADSLIGRIAKITKETGGYVTQLDALNAVSFGGNITDNMDFFIDNLDKIIKLSKVAGVDFKEASDAIARFIESGSGLEDLVRLEVISASQKEALEKSGTAGQIGKQGIRARTAQAQVFLSEGAPRVNEFFKEFEKTGGATIDKIKTSGEELVVTIGEKLNPKINEAGKALDGFIGRLKKGIGEDKGFIDTIKSAFGNEQTSPIKQLPGGNISNSSQSIQDNSVTNNTINVNGAQNPTEAAAEIERRIAKKVITNQQRRIVPQSLNTTIQPIK